MPVPRVSSAAPVRKGVKLPHRDRFRREWRTKSPEPKSNKQLQVRSANSYRLQMPGARSEGRVTPIKRSSCRPSARCRTLSPPPAASSPGPPMTSIPGNLRLPGDSFSDDRPQDEKGEGRGHEVEYGCDVIRHRKGARIHCGNCSRTPPGHDRCQSLGRIHNAVVARGIFRTKDISRYSREQRISFAPGKEDKGHQDHERNRASQNLRHHEDEHAFKRKGKGHRVLAAEPVCNRAPHDNGDP